MADNSWKKGTRVRTKTYSIGLILVGVVILFQLGALVSVFLLRRAVQIDSDAPLLSVNIRLPVDDPSLDNATISGVEKTSSPGSTETATHSSTGSTPRENPILQPYSPNGRLSLKTTLDPSERILTINKEADRFISDGDLDLAKAALLEAENLDPDNVQTLRHEAILAESMNDPHRASVYWQRIFVLGPAAGEAYILAEEKLKAAANPLPVVSSQLNKVTQVFVAGPIQQSVRLDNESAYEFELKIPITLLDTENAVRPADISIKLFFYDLSIAGDVLPTRAVRTVGFINQPPTWTLNKTEVLQAKYRLTRTPEDNKCYGYTFRLYYQGKLQEEQASPRKLLSMFPSPGS